MADSRRSTVRQAWTTFANKGASSSSYFKEVRPMLLIFRLCGRLPCSITENGISFSFVSFPVFYTAAVYTFLVYVSVKSLLIMNDEFSKNRSYNKSLNLIIVISYLSQNLFVPCSFWAQIPKLQSYLNMWSNFESDFGREFCRLRNRRLILYCCAVFFPLGVAHTLVVLVWLKVENKIFPVTALVPIAINSYMVLTMWSLSLVELRQQVQSLSRLILREGLRKDLDRKRRCWLVISQMTTAVGESQGAACGGLSLSSFIALLISIYGFFSSVFDFREDAHVEWRLCLPFILCSSFFLLVFESCERATKEVGSKFTSMVLSVKDAHWTQIDYDEVPLLFFSMSLSRPIIKFSGFVVVDRYLFASLITSTVTFLFVLIQFKS